MAVNMFITFLNMTISGSLAAVLLILWRRATYRYIPSKFYYGLWLVLMCRLVVPFNIKSAFSVLNLFEKAGDMSFGNSYVVTMEYLDYPSLVSGAPHTVPAVLEIAAVVWLAVAVFFIVQWLYVAFITEKHLAYSVLHKSDVAQQVKADIGLKRNVKVYTSPHVVSPLVAGFVKPRVIIPSENTLSDEEKRFTLAHEMVHIKRYDYLLKAIFYFIVSLHWYNPLVWYCFWLFNEDIEISCDQQVLTCYGAEHKSRYANILFEHAKRKNIFKLGVLSFTGDKVTARIEKVLMFKHLSMPKAVLFMAVTLVIGLCSSTNPVLAADYQYVPKTVYVNSTVRNEVRQFAADFANDIESNNVDAIISKSTADAPQLAAVYSIFENSDITMELEKVFYTSKETADVYFNLAANDGTVFPKGTETVVVQLDSSKVMGGLYAQNLHSFNKYNSINKIDHSDEAVMLVEKMIKFGLTDGSNTPQNAAKLTAFCMDIAYDRGAYKGRTAIPQNEVESIANEFFLFNDFSNLHNTDYYDKTQKAYIYNASMGTKYEYAITAFEKDSDKAVVTVEFYKDPLQTQVETKVKYTLKKV
ncbi:MAG: M56 family metallopeptidase [Oscillospiraceae bacterium]|nr:M56 family metallopeptidase [Oscillospiraceae bacterium]